jgi:peptidoglycan hydrolase CwlO-like protein
LKSARASKKARTGAAAFAAVILVAVLVGPVGASTKSDLAAAEKDLDGLISKIASEQKDVDALHAEATAIAKRMDAVQSSIARTQGTIVDLEQGIRLAGQQLDASRKQLDHRAWVAYENGPGSNIEFLLGSTSLSDFTDRLEIVNHVAQTDQDLINQITDQRILLQGKQVKLEGLEAQLVSKQKQLKGQQDDLSEKIAQGVATLNQLDQDKADAAAIVDKLKKKLAAEVAAAKAAALLAAEQSHGNASGSISGVLLVCPVTGFPVYSDDFGAPRYGGGYHLHAGNDVFAARGTPIQAPFPGVVSDASNGLGGNSLIVTGSLGYVYNAHMDSFVAGIVGSSVSTGQTIGYVGDSGDAKGGATHDHFEWHPNTIPAHPWTSPYGASIIGSAIDPYPYLNSVC